MMEIIFLVAGVLIGGIAAWFIAGSRAQSRSLAHIAELQSAKGSAEAIVAELRRQICQKESELTGLRDGLNAERSGKVETATRLAESYKRLEGADKNIEEQKRLIEAMKAEMVDTFKAHASAALKSSNEDFLKLASEHLGKILADTKGKLGEHRASLDGTIKPLQEMLARYEQQLKDIEEKRHKSFGSLSEQIKALSAMQENLQKETGNLVTALRTPRGSGSWGQMSLRRAAELAGMTAYCDFTEQVSVATDTGRLQPDMLIHLPNGRQIVVDAKAPVDAYLHAVSESSEGARRQAMENYVKNVKGHIDKLGSKAYWDNFPKSPEMVVMYLPGESFFSAAIEQNNELIEYSSSKKVILATPTTFIALLKAVAYGWQQEQVTRNAQEIIGLGKELYDRFSIVMEHFSDIGDKLGKASEAYNKGVASIETRLLPSVRKFKEMGISSPKELISAKEIDVTPKNGKNLVLEFEDKANL
ncbi:MAG: DNA recombination protein RmuC [Deltaproteobacteria bacterium]|nr:DNA recombination protein RmuC [Deltaproteobacteria bacterium]